MIKMAKSYTPEDADRDIQRLEARKRGRGLTAGEQRALDTCYAWLEQHFSKERD